MAHKTENSNSCTVANLLGGYGIDSNGCVMRKFTIIINARKYETLNAIAAWWMACTFHADRMTSAKYEGEPFEGVIPICQGAKD